MFSAETQVDIHNVCLINKPHQNTQTQKRYISKDHLSRCISLAMCSQCGSQYIRPFLKGWPGHSSFAMVNLSFFVHSIVWVVNRALVWMIFDLLPIMRCPRLSCEVTDKPALHEMSTFREARGYQNGSFFWNVSNDPWPTSPPPW